MDRMEVNRYIAACFGKEIHDIDITTKNLIDEAILNANLTFSKYYPMRKEVILTNNDQNLTEEQEQDNSGRVYYNNTFIIPGTDTIIGVIKVIRQSSANVNMYMTNSTLFQSSFQMVRNLYGSYPNMDNGEPLQGEFIPPNKVRIKNRNFIKEPKVLVRYSCLYDDSLYDVPVKHSISFKNLVLGYLYKFIGDSNIIVNVFGTQISDLKLPGEELSSKGNSMIEKEEIHLKSLPPVGMLAIF